MSQPARFTGTNGVSGNGKNLALKPHIAAQDSSLAGVAEPGILSFSVFTIIEGMT